MIKYCLIVLLSLLTLSSCLSTQVSTHTIPDGVGKEVYHWVSWPDKVELYERGGVYYARCEFYRVPARKTLYTTHILGKGHRGYSYHLNSRPEYREGMPTINRYMALDKKALKHLLPGRRYVAPPPGEQVLSQKHFEGVDCAAQVSAHSFNSVFALPPALELPVERNALNYALMPVTAVLYVTDAALSVVCTTAGWVGFNLPFVTIVPLCCLIEESFDN